MANPIEQAAKAIRSRLAELVGEQEQLQKALGALEGLAGSERGGTSKIPARKSAPRRRPARRAAASNRGRSAAQRPRGGPSRADQFLKLRGVSCRRASTRWSTSRQAGCGCAAGPSRSYATSPDAPFRLPCVGAR